MCRTYGRTYEVNSGVNSGVFIMYSRQRHRPLSVALCATSLTTVLFHLLVPLGYGCTQRIHCATRIDRINALLYPVRALRPREFKTVTHDSRAHCTRRFYMNLFLPPFHRRCNRSPSTLSLSPFLFHVSPLIEFPLRHCAAGIFLLGCHFSRRKLYMRAFSREPGTSQHARFVEGFELMFDVLGLGNVIKIV